MVMLKSKRYGLDKEVQMDGRTNAWQIDTKQSVWVLKKTNIDIFTNVYGRKRTFEFRRKIYW